ncbi:hypothetical protein Micbo1qcDRAFT_170135 [Microdochium bolleyi]|uniref:Uncharacterized protein n=1 Tax=Microdochium bolleyi TaxID=196109 RepID=A0A136JGP7_9PEZI|nr:hypothetical protein Micbo1qcDRAFT_170135 [Microdochium bolleyi]
MRFTTACGLPTVGFAVLASAACVRKSSSPAQIYHTVSTTSSDITASSLLSSIISITSSVDVTVSSSTLTSSTISNIPYCSSVSSYFAADGGSAAATSFCSSHLGMPRQTATVNAVRDIRHNHTDRDHDGNCGAGHFYEHGVCDSDLYIHHCHDRLRDFYLEHHIMCSANDHEYDHSREETVAIITVPLSETETTAITPAATKTNTITNTMTVALVATTIQTTTVYTTTTYILAVPTFSLRALYTDTGSASPRTDQAIMMPSPYGQAQFYPLGTPPGSMISQFRQPAAGEMDSIGRSVDPGALIGLVRDGSVRYLYTENTGLRFTVYGNTISQPYHGVVCTLITLPSSAGFDGTCPLTCKGWAGTMSFDWLENQSPAASRWNIAGDGTAQQYGGVFVPYAVSP